MHLQHLESDRLCGGGDTGDEHLLRETVPPVRVEGRGGEAGSSRTGRGRGGKVDHGREGGPVHGETCLLDCRVAVTHVPLPKSDLDNRRGEGGCKVDGQEGLRVEEGKLFRCREGEELVFW